MDQKIAENLELYLEGRLSAEEKERIEKILQDYKELRDYFQFLKELRTLAKAVPKRTAPPDLIEKVISKIQTSTILSPWQRWMPVTVSALASLLLGLYIGRNIKSQPEMVSVTFSLKAPRAESVQLAGDFTNWKPVALKRKREIWNCTLKVPKGRFQYIFILNRRTFVIDPETQELEQDESGEVYSVLDTTKGI